ncbi:MAG: hypothetical protein ABF289_20680 [Clostridiales bacterium]
MEDFRNKPMSFGDWMKTFIILMIPLVNFIFFLIWVFGSDVNTSKKNYLRALFVFNLIIFILIVIAGGVMYAVLPDIIENITDSFKSTV